MYNLRIDFFEVEDEEKIGLYLHSLRMAGISLSQNSVLCYEAGVLSATILVAEDQKEIEAYYTKLARKRFKLASSVTSEIRFSVTGRATSEPVKYLTNLEGEPFLIFKLGYNGAISMWGGGDYLPIPMYYLPATYEGESYDNLQSWRSQYLAIDRLYMNDYYFKENSKDVFYHEISNPESTLSLQGREICEIIFEKSGKNTYYYLYHNPYDKKFRSGCPGCGAKWKLNEPLLKEFSYFCEECSLIG